MAEIVQALKHVKFFSQQTERVIHALIILPLESQRIEKHCQFADEKIQNYTYFMDYHIRDHNEETQRHLVRHKINRDKWQ